jgi:hypothetical protein
MTTKPENASEIFTEVSLKDSLSAISLFIKARDRMLNINAWNGVFGVDEPSYRLTDDKGNPKTGLAAVGDYIEYNPTLTKPGHNSKWLHIERIEYLKKKDYRELITMHFVPSNNPQVNPHFEAGDSEESILSIERNRQTILASIQTYDNEPEGEGLWHKIKYVYYKYRNECIPTKRWKMLANFLLKQNASVL